MRLISVVLGFVLRQLWKYVALVLVMFLALLIIQTVIPSLRESIADRDRLAQVSAERAALERQLDQAVDSLEEPIRARAADSRRKVSDQATKVDDLRKNRDEVCGLVDRVIDALTPGSKCKAAEAALEKADEALDSLEETVVRAEADLAVLGDPDLTTEQKLDRLSEDGERTAAEQGADATQAEISEKQAEEAQLRQAQDSWTAWVVDKWARHWKWLAAVAALFLLLPPALRTFNFFVLMPLVARIQKPVRLADDREDAAASLTTGEALRTLPIHIDDGDVLFARSEHVRPVSGGQRRSQLLYDWSAPFISFAAGLHGLTRITGDTDGATTTLATPEDPDSYLMRIDFSDHPGVVMRPSHVVGVMGHPELRTRWRWGIQALATWQVRYIMFAGTGSVIVQGRGDVSTANPEGQSTRMDQHLVMGFDSRLTMSVNRTEVFLPYLLGRTPLVDDEFSGPHLLFWQKSSNTGPSTPIARTFDAFFSGIGKLLGF